MSEKMLVTQALDERDLLVKKIGDKIEKIQLVDSKKRNEEKTVNARLSVEEFGNAVSAAYQQIMDLIERYQRIDAAIVASNAKTYVQTSYGKYTVAGAIALRNRLQRKGIYRNEANFESLLIEKMEQQYRLNVQIAENKNKNLESQAEVMRNSILGKDSKVKDDKPLEVVEIYVRENTMEVIDPLDTIKKGRELQEKIDTLLKELDTQIKVSNATTTVEF